MVACRLLTESQIYVPKGVVDYLQFLEIPEVSSGTSVKLLLPYMLSSHQKLFVQNPAEAPNTTAFVEPLR